jgi:hypothetical protein
VLVLVVNLFGAMSDLEPFYPAFSRLFLLAFQLMPRLQHLDIALPHSRSDSRFLLSLFGPLTRPSFELQTFVSNLAQDGQLLSAFLASQPGIRALSLWGLEDDTLDFTLLPPAILPHLTMLDSNIFESDLDLLAGRPVTHLRLETPYADPIDTLAQSTGPIKVLDAELEFWCLADSTLPTLLPSLGVLCGFALRSIAVRYYFQLSHTCPDSSSNH